MHVPQRETGMTPYEIMLSESQERMLLVVKKGREAEVEAIFEKWDLHAAHIGEVTTDGLMRVKDHGKVVAEIPNTRAGRRGAGLRPADDAPGVSSTRCATLDLPSLPPVRAAGRAAARCSRRRRSRASAGSTASTTRWCAPTPSRRRASRAGVVRVKGTDRALAIVDRRQRPLLLSQSAARRDAGASPRRRATSPAPAACRSARTNCLNFGNPERPEIMWQLVEAVEGIAEACRALDIPITGGNVSLYNETDGTRDLPDAGHRRRRR